MAMFPWYTLPVSERFPSQIVTLAMISRLNILVRNFNNGKETKFNQIKEYVSVLIRIDISNIVPA